MAFRHRSFDEVACQVTDKAFGVPVCKQCVSEVIQARLTASLSQAEIAGIKECLFFCPEACRNSRPSNACLRARPQR